MKHRAVRVIAQLAVSAALSSCGLFEDPEPAPPDEIPDSPFGSIVGSGTLVFLERWECFGSCPAYSLSISGDGTVSYFGMAYVNVKGQASKQVSVDDVQALVDEMLAADYFNLSVSEDCPAGMLSDAPGATTSLTFHGQAHAVEHYHGDLCAPASLRRLEDAIDNFADISAWIECDTPGGACCELDVNLYLFPCGR